MKQKRTTLHQYESKPSKDLVTISKIGATSVAEIVMSENGEEVDDGPRIQKVKKMSKDERVGMIKDMLKQELTREQIKQQMYNKGVYAGNPNPPSAFAGDWKAAQ